MIQIILHYQVKEHQVQELLKVISDRIPISGVMYSHNGLPKTELINTNRVGIADTCFYVKHKDRYIKIAVDDILWVKGDGSGVKIITENGQYSGMVNLQSFMKQIQHPHLLRIHKSYVVNKCKLAAFDAGAVYIEYKGKEEVLAIGTTYRDDFKKEVLRLLAD